MKKEKIENKIVEIDIDSRIDSVLLVLVEKLTRLGIDTDNREITIKNRKIIIK